MDRKEREELRDRALARFEQLQKDEGWTQQDLSDESGIPLRTLNAIINGNRVPNRKNLTSLLNAMGLAETEEGERHQWPADVQVHLDMLGLYLSQRDEAERGRVMQRITRVLMEGGPDSAAK